MTPGRSKLIATALRRGLRKRCPHCGDGRLFSGWSFFERCSTCGLVFARNPGDIWAFTIIGDRLPVGAIIVLIARFQPGGILALLNRLSAKRTTPSEETVAQEVAHAP